MTEHTIGVNISKSHLDVLTRNAARQSVLRRPSADFVSVMNFVIFPVFFLSTALYPLWRMAESSRLLCDICAWNPFSHAVELIRFALYMRLKLEALGWVALTFAVFLAFALWGFDPARGIVTRKAR